MMAANGDVNDVEMGLLENQNDEDFLNSKSLKFSYYFLTMIYCCRTGEVRTQTAGGEDGADTVKTIQVGTVGKKTGTGHHVAI